MLGIFQQYREQAVMSLTPIQSDPSKTSRRLRRGAAAEYLGISKSTLAKLACYGGGPAMICLGGRRLYDTDELDRYMAARVRRSTSDDGSAAVAA